MGTVYGKVLKSKKSKNRSRNAKYRQIARFLTYPFRCANGNYCFTSVYCVGLKKLQKTLQSNSVITNSWRTMGTCSLWPWIRCNLEHLCSEVIIWDWKIRNYLFVIAVITVTVITEFDCIINKCFPFVFYSVLQQIVFPDVFSDVKWSQICTWPYHNYTCILSWLKKTKLLD